VNGLSLRMHPRTFRRNGPGLAPADKVFLTSAVERPGNSGGPIVAQDGRVIGIVVDHTRGGRRAYKHTPRVGNRFATAAEFCGIVAVLPWHPRR